jgi:hypothetical protein
MNLTDDSSPPEKQTVGHHGSQGAGVGTGRLTSGYFGQSGQPSSEGQWNGRRQEFPSRE